MWVDAAAIIASAAAFFIFGWLFFVRQLFQNYEVRPFFHSAKHTHLVISILQVRDRVVQILFAAVFTFSCVLFELLILEILNELDATTRLVVWRFSLVVLLLALVGGSLQ